MQNGVLLQALPFFPGRQLKHKMGNALAVMSKKAFDKSWIYPPTLLP
jgi:hypothetical protein